MEPAIAAVVVLQDANVQVAANVHVVQNQNEL